MTLERPMFPPSRRGFLAMTAGAAAAVGIPVAAKAHAPSLSRKTIVTFGDSEISPDLKDATEQFMATIATMDAAHDVFNHALKQMGAWEKKNKEPRYPSRAYRKFEARRDKAFSSFGWEAAYNASRATGEVFREAQKVVALHKAANLSEVRLKAAIAVAYEGDAISGKRGGFWSLIAHSAAMDMVRLTEAL